MIYHIAGRLGSGKTLFAVNKIIESLLYTKKHIYTNIRFVDGWDYLFAKYQTGGYKTFLQFFTLPFSSTYDFKLYLAGEAASRYHYMPELTEAVDTCMALGEGREASRLFFWDEIHTDLNARAWKSTSEKYIKFFSMSRKLGFDIFMISQLRSAVDRQMRELADVGFEFKNLSHFRPMGIKIFPFDVGLLVKRWANKGFEAGDNKTVFVGAGFVRYGGEVAGMYNTRQIVTQHNHKEPYLWSGGKVQGLCGRCAYTSFYHKYGIFIKEFGPSESYEGELPKRLIAFLQEQGPEKPLGSGPCLGS
jgi:hypothetical protein